MNEYKKAREWLGLSILAVSQRLGINRNNLSNFEKDKFNLNEDDLMKLESFYSSRGYDFNYDNDNGEKIINDFINESEKEINNTADINGAALVAVENIIENCVEIITSVTRGAETSSPAAALGGYLEHDECTRDYGLFGESSTTRRINLVKSIVNLLLSEIKINDEKTYKKLKAMPENSDFALLSDYLSESYDDVFLV